MAKLSVVQYRVEQLLINFPVTRNNDRRLIRRYMINYHNITTFNEYCNDADAPALESITRCRRKFQSKGYYLPKPIIAEGRIEEEEDHRRFFT